MKLLQNSKQGVYVMRDRKITQNPEFIALASWGNTMGAFKMPFKEIMEKSKRLRPYKKYFNTILQNNLVNTKFKLFDLHNYLRQ